MSSPIPGYQIIRKIGTGGMSTVYLAIQLSVGREVALKILSPELCTDAKFTERFYYEANVVGRFSHPNIVSIFDIGKHDKHYYIAMDYLPGGTCKKLLEHTQLSPEQALAILSALCNALEHVHNHGFLHCDIKPENIMFRRDESVVLTDFGIAKTLPYTPKRHGISGTPHYMSPEQVQSETLESSSDIYSLGILLYELLTGHVPYQGKDLLSIAKQHIYAPLPQLPPTLKVFQPLLDKMLAKKSKARFQNCTELKYAIDFFEAQFLRKKQTLSSIKLRTQLLIQSLSNRGKAHYRTVNALRLSAKHGLVLQLHHHTLAAKTIYHVDLSEDNITQAILSKDTLSQAIFQKKATKILSIWPIAIVVIVLILVFALPPLIETILHFLPSNQSPEIIFID